MTPSAADYSKEPRHETHRFRGRTFEFRELLISEYDAVVARATSQKQDPLPGESSDFLDTTLQLKLMVEASAGVSLREQSTLGTRLVRGLNAIVNKMHFGDEPDELKDGSDDGEGKGSQPES